MSAIIITANQGIGFYLANYLKSLAVSTWLCSLIAEDVGGIASTIHPIDLLLNVNTAQVANLNYPAANYFIWSTGVFLKKPLIDTLDLEISNLIKLHLTFPMKLLSQFHSKQKKPYHLIVIASCSSWRLRYQEALYCGLSAAKATFTRNFANDLITDIPGSKVTLINPGGLKTPYYYQDEDKQEYGYLDYEWLAKYIWDRVINQTTKFQEVQVLRSKQLHSAEVIIEEGPKLPEFIL